MKVLSDWGRFVRELARNADLEAFGAETFLVHNHQGCLADAFRRGIEQQCLGVHLFAAGPAFGREVRIPGELQRYFSIISHRIYVERCKRGKNRTLPVCPRGFRRRFRTADGVHDLKAGALARRGDDRYLAAE